MAKDNRPEVLLISHSPVFYWWPAWVSAYLVALTTLVQGQPIAGDEALGYVHPSNNPGLMFIAVMSLLMIFTNAKLRGVYSFLTLAVLAFFVVLFAWLGWWDQIFAFIPQLSARANAGFYLVFGTVMLTIWLTGFFIFDRLTYWRIRPGQLIEERLVGAAAHSHDTNGLVCEKREQDFFRHIILGLGAGDLKLSAPGKEPVYIPNVLFADQKMREVEKLVAVKPDHAVDEPKLVMPSHA